MPEPWFSTDNPGLLQQPTGEPKIMNGKPDYIIPEPTLRRLPRYYNYLQTLLNRGREVVSCTHIGKDLDLDPPQIRKDLACTGIRGVPKVGYQVAELIKSIINLKL